MVKIIDVRDQIQLMDKAVDFFWKQWGAESNFHFYRDCIVQSCQTESDVPRFYLAMDGETIIGSYALLRSDLNSRQDLTPWLACLFVEPDYRGRKIGDLLQNHAIQEARKKGYARLYLCTDLTDYYERTQWTYIGNGYSIFDEETRIYAYEL